MAKAEDLKSLKQENFAWSLRINELEEKTEWLEWELEVAQFQKEQAEAKAAGLEQWLQAGKMEGGSKEIKRLMAAEVERTHTLEQPIVKETQKSREREKKMQREMKAWTVRSQEAGTTQAGEQKEVLQKLEVSRSLIGVLQREVHSQEDRIKGLQDEVEKWQQKCISAEQLIQKLRDTLHENQALTEEKGKVISQEMEEVKAYMANYEVLRDWNLSLERELEAGMNENDRLRSQLQSVETGKRPP
ncbi:hypothetical protein Y1Q_0023306 [Alligator mississippiensis]|uniref:Uncharacterized protein n=1 Tax=Alligator mississippiensis TaxID=8496 RepID=A0A151NQ08_ALLMI|nr:hypothetical protein Y1Q_0023306 [Alligator mississippiensis]